MKIEAAVCREAGTPPRIEMLEIEEPRAGEILVRIVASGICHADLGVAGRPGPRPFVLGHEGAGIVERVGAGVAGLVPGDHVVLSANFCGDCPSCRQQAYTYCYELLPRNFGGSRIDGSTPLLQDGKPVHARFFGQSSFATYSVADATAAIKAPKDIPLEMRAPLGCGVQTGAGTVINSFKLRPGQTIAVFGAGGVGLSAVMVARIAGAARIVAIDPVRARLDLAAELGATDMIDAAAGDAAAAVRQLFPHGVDFTLNIPTLIEFYRQGRFPFDRLIRYYPLVEIAHAFRDSEEGRTIRPVLRMPH